MSEENIKLTALSHGGGCGCKLAPGVLQKLLAGVKPGIIPPQLLVGTETSDDAAVYQINAAGKFSAANTAPCRNASPAMWPSSALALAPASPRSC